MVALAGNRRFGQHAGSLLEGGRGDERLGGQRRLGDTQQHPLVLGRELVLGNQGFVLFQYLGQLDLVTLDEAGVTGLGDLNLAQHLTDGHFDVLVVDLHTLQAVHVLNLVDDVLGQLADTQQAQDIVRVARTIGDDLTLGDLFTLEHVQVAPLRNQLLVRIAAIHRSDDQAALALGFLAEGNGTADFRQDCRLLRTTRLEQVGHTRQTTGDVPGLGGFTRNTRDHVTDVHFNAVGQVDLGLLRQEVLRRHIGTRQHQLLAIGADQLDGRTDVLTGGRTLVNGHHLDVAQTGQLVGLTTDGDPLFHADELDGTGDLGNDRVGVRVPLGHDLTGLHLFTLMDQDDRTVGQLVTLALTTELVGQCQLTGTGYRYQRAVITGHVLEVAQADGTGALDLDAVLSGGPAGGTTDVEGTHGQLGTRLTDGLGSDNTHCLTDVDQVTTCQIATIAGGAHAVAGLAGDRRTHDDLVDTVGLEEVNQLLVDQGTGGQNDFFRARLENILGGNPAQYALAQRLDDITTFDMRLHDQTLVGATVDLGDHQVLGHVNQTTGQVTGVRGLQCGIGQTLTGTVGRDEVLQYVQTFTEVGDDRCLDDGAVRLGHQTPHTCQLADLCSGTPGTGVGHHVHGVEGFVGDIVAFTILDAVDLEVLHHGLGDLVVGA